MPFTKIDTPSLQADAVDNTILDLSSDFAFTGTITGDNSGSYVHLGTTESTSNDTIISVADKFSTT